MKSAYGFFSILAAIVITSLSIHSTAIAVNSVVIIPMSGAPGDATASDVLTGKTFSSSAGKGLTGTRPPAPVAKTGQVTTITTLSGQDGALLKGESWPTPRFPSHIITLIGVGQQDALTRLSWEPRPGTGTMNWSSAVTYCENMETGGINGAPLFADWRLPNVRELLSLIDYENINTALPTGHPFQDVRNSGYWSSTHWFGNSDEFVAWVVNMGSGNSTGDFKGNLNYAWCVRGGSN